jgi:ParB family transcriptional regulator, chromosome partitioning protein
LELRAGDSTNNIKRISLDKISTAVHDLRSDVGGVSELADSISRFGLLHPLVVRRSQSKSVSYQVICGMRRLIALRRLGETEVPCKVTNATDKESFEIALSENLQRKQLDPVEEALAFRHYIRVCKWGNARNLALKIGKSEQYVSHRLNLLELPDSILAMIGNELSPSHAEELACLNDLEDQLELAKTTVEHKLSVKDLHELARQRKIGREQSHVIYEKHQGTKANDWLPSIKDNEDRLTVHLLQTNVVGIRYLLNHIDNCINQIEKFEKNEELIAFMIEERFRLHEVLDHFLKKVSEAKDGKLKIHEENPPDTLMISIRNHP